MARRLAPHLLAVTLALGLAGAANASSISFVWISTSGGAYGVGTPTLSSVALSDTAVLEIRVHVGTEGVNAVSVSALFNPAILTATEFEVCPPAPGNDLATSCGGFANSTAGVSGLLVPQGTPTLNNVGGEAGHFLAAAPVPGEGQLAGTFELTHVTFHATGLGSMNVTPFFQPGVDGAVSLASNVFIPSASGAFISVEYVPEPGTAGLLGLGLLLVVAIARRARR